MRLKQITVPLGKDHAQSTRISLKSMEGDLDGMVSDLNRHISGAATKTGAETLENKTLASPTIDTATINSPTIETPTINTPTITSPAITGDVAATGLGHFHNATALPAGGDANVGIKVGTSGIGLFFGSGAPTLTAPQGSIYIRSDGSAANNRFYVRTASGWTNGTTAA